MLNSSHLGRYRDLALLFNRYGRRDFTLDMTADDVLATPPEDDRELEPDVQARAQAFAAALQKMGPTFVKFGQILSTRPDIIPQEYAEALEALQDSVDPFPFADVEKIVEEELKVRMSKAFESFDPTPIAAASLGQVHRASLRDGREVVVKVQRPGIREIIDKDLEVFTQIAEFLDKHSTVGRKMNFVGTLQQARRSIISELDYRQEADNTERFRRSLAEFEKLHVPAVVFDYSTSKILTTDLVRGKKVSQLSPLSLIDHNYADLAIVLTRAYLKQICVDGFWHSDPHPGNVFVRDGELVLLDFGMTARMSGEFQDDVIRLLLALTNNRGEEVAEICIKTGTLQEGFDQKKFMREISDLVTQYHDANLKRTNTGRLIFSVIAIASSNEIQIPSELAMLAKTMLHLDGITRILDPDYNPREVIRDYSESLVSQKIRQKFHPRNFYSAFIDLNQLAIESPRRIRDVLEQLPTGKLTFTHRLENIDELLKGMHKIANRIAIGLVIAGLIVGSSLLMGVETRLRVFGYPLIAMVGYLAASAIGFYLVVTTLMRDRRDNKKARSRIRH